MGTSFFERLPEFLANHSTLAMAFFVMLGFLVWSIFQTAGRGVRKLSPTDVTRLINDEEAIVVDVRTDGEYRQGHILNAMNIPEKMLPAELEKLAKYRERPIITTCRTGQSSVSAGNTLRKNGFEKVYSLHGGISAWEGANLPLTKG